MTDNFKRFDMSIPPRKPKWYLKPIGKLLFSFGYKVHHPIITYENGSKDFKGPFFLLCNHNAFLDFKVCYRVVGKNDSHFIVAIDGYLGRENLMRNIGCICKRKFTNDIVLIRNIKKAIDMKDVVIMYPEARYSLCGTTAVIQKSIAKMAKMLDVPLLTLICHGHHINSPFWDTSHERNVSPTEATYKVLFTQEELRKASVEEIYDAIINEFQYDDFKWQKERGIIVNDPNRAKGLHRVLYQCPNCKKEYRMDSFGTKLVCKECGKEWEMTELGELKALDGKDIFTHIPDWYEWERSNVKKEVEEGTYNSGVLNVQVDSLPNPKKYIDLGHGTLVHDMNGFRVSVTDKDGVERSMVKDVPSLYSCHIEYQYLFKKGDCVDLNTLTDTWYIYPEGEHFAVTKMALATEELYFKWEREKNLEKHK